MAKRTLWTILIGLFVLILIGVAGGYFYLTHTRTTIEAVREQNGTSGDVAPFSDLPPLQPANPAGSSKNPLVGEVPKLRKISATPIAGADIFDRKTGSTTQAFIRYVDKGTGNIYETSTSSLDTIRITNTTIPKVGEAFFGAGGNTVIMRYPNDNDIIQTFLGKVSGTSTDLTGGFISQNANPLILSPSKTRFFYMLQGTTGALGYISDFVPKFTSVFSQPIRGWLGYWPNETTLVFWNKPSAFADGVAYQMSTTGGSLTKLMGPKSGLTVLPSPKVDILFYAATYLNGFQAGFHDVKSGQERIVGYPTLPDKCIWAPGRYILYCGVPKGILSADYPDAWYQGTISFNDNIASIDPFSTQVSALIDPQSASGEPIDATDLHLSSDEDYLIFTNKKDLSLWGLRLN